ncbi:MAG: hypothetical protein ACHRXM_38900 [Isosphaerales bacterium]
MTTKTNQSALALTAAIFTATLLASTSIPAYASERAGGSHSVGHGPIAPPHGGQKGGGTLVSCSPGTGCTETQVKGPTVYHNVPGTPTVYHSGTEHVVNGFGTAPIASPVSGPVSVVPPPTVYHSGTEHVVNGFGTTPTSGQISGQVSGVVDGALGKGTPSSGTTSISGQVNGVVDGALGTGSTTSGSTQTSGTVVGTLNGGHGIIANCVLFGCKGTTPTPPTGGGNPPKHGGGHDGDHDHGYPGIVIEGAPGEVVVPAPVAAVPLVAAPVIAARAPAAAPQVVQGPCNCLTKQTLADGSVLFQDICTKEAAIAAPQSASVR